jgi:hypothetical protein
MPFFILFWFIELRSFFKFLKTHKGNFEKNLDKKDFPSNWTKMVNGVVTLQIFNILLGYILNF